MRTLFLFACLLALSYQAYGVKQAVARINARGITGTITFIAVDEDSTRVIVNLRGLTGNQGWHVHTLPIDQTIDQDEQCLSQWAGPHYDPFNARPDPNYSTLCSNNPANCEAGDLAGRLGPLTSDGQLDKTDNTGQIKLEGFYSIVGRSVVIHEMTSNANFECGTILPQEEINGARVTILQSLFVSPAAGRMYFKQVDGLPDVQVWGKLYHVDDSNASLEHNWHIHKEIPGVDYRKGVCGPAGPHYDPTNQDANSAGYSDRCNRTMPEGCEIGDLTGKLGTVNVAATPAPYNYQSFFFTDSLLNLTGFQGVVNRSVVIHVANRGAARLSCAPLVQAENITLTAYPFGGQPLAIISQYSRYQDTQISLGSLPAIGVPPSLGSDNPDLTVLTAAVAPNGACLLDADATPTSDSTYSPYNVRSGVTTPDTYDLGDISKAYKDEVKSNNIFSVFDLPVFGANVTVSGRVLRYTYGNRRVCVPLLPPTSGTNVVALRASFSGRDIGGNVYFVQDRRDDVITDSTLIIVDIYYKEGSRSKTSSHNWHVHSNPSAAGQECTPVIGGHFNPFSVSLDTDTGNFSNYGEDCTPNYQLRCESGDMSGKHGRLEIASFTAANRPTYSYVDNNLELGGNYTINGRSVGLHLPTTEGGALFDCATITPFYKSDRTVVTYTPVRDFTTRTELVMKLAGDDISTNDILIVGQNVTNDCVVTTMRAIAENTDKANNYVTMLTERASSQFTQCDPNTSGAVRLSHLSSLLLLLPLLLTALLPSLH